MTDARRGAGRCDGGRRQAGDAQDGEVGGRIPPDKLGIERLAVVPADAQAVLAAERANRGDDDAVAVDESTGRTTPPVDLDDGRGDGRDRVRHLSREFIQHGAILTNAAALHITRMGGSGCRPG